MGDTLFVPWFDDANVYTLMIDKESEAFKELLGIFIKGLS